MSIWTEFELLATISLLANYNLFGILHNFLTVWWSVLETFLIIAPPSGSPNIWSIRIKRLPFFQNQKTESTFREFVFLSLIKID